MNAQATSVSALIATMILSDHRILQLAWTTPFSAPLGWAELREPTYLAHQPWSARLPDHVFDSAWERLRHGSLSQSAPLVAIKYLADEFTELRHGSVRLRRGLLGPWQQGICSRMSSVPVHAVASAQKVAGAGLSSSRLARSSHDHKAESRLSSQLPLLRPEEPSVADYIDREGLHETHLHLNGSTHAEICWLRAVHSPRAEIRRFVSIWRQGSSAARVRELIKQSSPELTPRRLFLQLQAASRLRAWLVAAANGLLGQEDPLPYSCEELCIQSDEVCLERIRARAPQCDQQFDVGSELAWMARLVTRLGEEPSIHLTRMFHAYVLLSNDYYKLLVQGESQFGFDQFQKFTLTELREPAEEDYAARFHAMHGVSRNSAIGYLEGRFAPKSDPSKASRLIQSILTGYLAYLRDPQKKEVIQDLEWKPLSRILTELEEHFRNSSAEHRHVHRLALVAHFIKQPWPPANKLSSGPYRHYPLFMQLRRTTGVLISMLSRWPRLRTWVRGIDAAANELHAPPDVFAPIFRACQRGGLTHRSYHAGEDFRHLLAGIATMRDALTLLDLRDGDRIGHGTAMGIRPSLWIDRMPDTLTITRGEWMLSLLASWQLSRDLSDMQASAQRLQCELENVASQIFRSSVSALAVERAMALRGLCRHHLYRHYTGTAAAYDEPLSLLWRSESDMVRDAVADSPDDVNLLWKWLSSPDVIERADDWILVESDFLDAASCVRLQQALMQMVSDRCVVIETLPSSNVRISQYYSVDEHHALRWMRVTGHVEEGDPEIMVSLGSDDPGIFAGDLETEFYLLYTTLRKHGMSDAASLQRLAVLNERGRVYRFHHHSLS